MAVQVGSRALFNRPLFQKTETNPLSSNKISLGLRILSLLRLLVLVFRCARVEIAWLIVNSDDPPKKRGCRRDNRKLITTVRPTRLDILLFT